MNINAETMGSTGSVSYVIDGKVVNGVTGIDTKNKFFERHVRDDKGYIVIHNGEVQQECVMFEMATIRFDNVIIEVN